MTLACKAGTSRLQNLANVDSEHQPPASQMSEMDTPLDHAGRGDASDGMGSNSDGELQPHGGVC